MKLNSISLSLLSALAIILFIWATASPATSVTRVYTNKTFNTAVNRTDTSAPINTLAYPFIELATATKGTDSLKMFIAIDYRIGTTWILNAVRDTLNFGDATTQTGKARGKILVGPYAATPFPGSTVIRIRNTLHPWAVADSTSAPSYTQTLLIRN